MIDKLQELWNKFLYKKKCKNYRECDKHVKIKIRKQKNMKTPKKNKKRKISGDS